MISGDLAISVGEIPIDSLSWKNEVLSRAAQLSKEQKLPVLPVPWLPWLAQKWVPIYDNLSINGSKPEVARLDLSHICIYV
jgi:hypothetical protein